MRRGAARRPAILRAVIALILLGAWRVVNEPEAVDTTVGQFVTLRVERLGAGGHRLETYRYLLAAGYWVHLEDGTNGDAEELIRFRPARL